MVFARVGGDLVDRVVGRDVQRQRGAVDLRRGFGQRLGRLRDVNRTPPWRRPANTSAMVAPIPRAAAGDDGDLAVQRPVPVGRRPVGRPRRRRTPVRRRRPTSPDSRNRSVDSRPVAAGLASGIGRPATPWRRVASPAQRPGEALQGALGDARPRTRSDPGVVPTTTIRPDGRDIAQQWLKNSYRAAQARGSAVMPVASNSDRRTGRPSGRRCCAGS